jgi:hypothetical protein
MTPILMLLALIALFFVWTASIKRQVLKHHQRRAPSHKTTTFYRPHTPADGVSARH